MTHPWDVTLKLSLVRKGIYRDLDGPMYQIDQGVNYFVLALEQAGAFPIASCEGHYEQLHATFYIWFYGQYELAEKLAKCKSMEISNVDPITGIDAIRESDPTFQAVVARHKEMKEASQIDGRASFWRLSIWRWEMEYACSLKHCISNMNDYLAKHPEELKRSISSKYEYLRKAASEWETALGPLNTTSLSSSVLSLPQQPS